MANDEAQGRRARRGHLRARRGRLRRREKRQKRRNRRRRRTWRPLIPPDIVQSALIAVAMHGMSALFQDYGLPKTIPPRRQPRVRWWVGVLPRILDRIRARLRGCVPGRCFCPPYIINQTDPGAGANYSAQRRLCPEAPKCTN